jgi:processive 1,2-diacylglycerol beta-glucosyltransferase
VGTHVNASAYAPHLYGRAYFASDHRLEGPAELLHAFDHWVGARLVREVVARRPRAVITTHFYPLVTLGAARQSGRLRAPLVSTVTDYAAHAVWAQPGADLYVAPRGRASADLIRHGVPRAQLFSSGVAVKRAFGEAPPLVAPLAEAKLRVLVTSGGFGVGPVQRVLESFAGVRGVELTVVCGNNPGLVERAREVVARQCLSAKVIGFERDMAARMAEAHVVVGKPGGSTLTEAFTSGRPMVLVGAVPGQETLNQAWAVAEGAAVVSNPDRVGSAVYTLRSRALLEPMGLLASQLVPKGAAARTVRAVLDLADSKERAVTAA